MQFRNIESKTSPSNDQQFINCSITSIPERVESDGFECSTPMELFSMSSDVNISAAIEGQVSQTEYEFYNENDTIVTKYAHNNNK